MNSFAYIILFGYHSRGGSKDSRPPPPPPPPKRNPEVCVGDQTAGTFILYSYLEVMYTYPTSVSGTIAAGQRAGHCCQRARILPLAEYTIS